MQEKLSYEEIRAFLTYFLQQEEGLALKADAQRGKEKLKADRIVDKF